MGDSDDWGVETAARRNATGPVLASAVVLVFLLSCLAHANPGDYVIVDRILARPWFATWLLVLGSTAATLVLFRTWAARGVTLVVLLVPAATCLVSQWHVAALESGEHRVLATSPDGKLSVVARDSSGFVDGYVEISLRTNAGWRSREGCLDRVADASVDAMESRFLAPDRVELGVTGLNGATYTWILDVDRGTLSARGSTGCRA
jgi:hypothetical protein